MRAYELLTEQSKIKDVKKFITKHCQPFLKEIGGMENIHEYVLYRGSKNISDDNLIIPAVNNRPPTNSSKILHNVINKAMQTAGIKARRDNSLFVTGNMGEAEQYGEVYVVIPIGSFEISWSNKIKDFYIDIVDYADEFTSADDISDFEEFHYEIDRETINLYEDDLLKFVKKYYKKKNLQKAIKSKNEIMILAEKYFLIKEDIFDSMQYSSMEEKYLSKIKNSSYPWEIRYIKNPTEEMKWEAIKRDGSNLEFIDNPTEEMKWQAIKDNGINLKHVKNPTKEMQREALKNNSHAIQYIENPTEEMKWKAIKIDPMSLAVIDNPTEEMQKFAFKKNKSVMPYIKNPTEEMKWEAIKDSVRRILIFDNPTEEMQMYAVKKDKTIIHFIKNPSPKAKELHKKLWENR